MHQRAQQISDLTLEFEMIVFKKAETVREKGKFCYKKPRLIRMEEVGEYKNGAVAVISADGKARGHYGGAMKFVKLTLSPDAPELKAANGYPLKDADFLSLTNYLKQLLAAGNKSRVSEQPVSLSGISQPVVVLEIYSAHESQNVLKRIFVNPETHFPVRWDDFDYPDQSSTTWNNIKVNTGLSDKLFSM
jgi:outer membrane lipoprotein-sorting protein